MIKSSEKTSQLLADYFEIEKNKIVLLDRAFLGLYAVFKELKKTNKNKILFTSTTCPSPVFASIYAECEPIFTDISLTDYLMDEKQSIKSIDENINRLAAVVLIYTFGHTDKKIIRIKEYAKKFHIPIIEDVAQAFGGCIGKNTCGKIGDVSIFSFGYSKHIDAGAGGFMLINNKQIFDKNTLEMKIEKISRSSPDYNLEKVYKQSFYNLRKKALIDPTKFLEFNDFILMFHDIYFKKIYPDWFLINKKINNFIKNSEKEIRNINALKYKNGIDKLKLNKKIFTPKVKNDYSVYRYTILVKDYSISSQLSDFLREKGVHCSNLYLPVSRFFNNENFQNAVMFSQRCINLWVEPDLDDCYFDSTLEYISYFFTNN